jgi:hypothetical protein
VNRFNIDSQTNTNREFAFQEPESFPPIPHLLLMEIPITHHQKIERLEAEKRQLEDRIRQLKHAAQTAERKRLTRAKIILGSLMLRNHAELLPKLVDEASPQDRELLHSVFPNAARKDPPLSVSSQ